MKRLVGRFFRRRLPPLLALALTAALCARVPLSYWQTLGKEAALFVASWQQPQQSVAYWQEQLSSAQALPVAEETTSTTAASLSVSATPIPPKTDGGGAVDEQQLDGGTPSVGAVAVRNGSGVDYDLAALFAEGSPVTLAQTDEPQVLIVHTHTTESYMSYYAGYYNADDASRSSDERENIVAVGEAVAQQLRAAGIGVIHDATVHDDPVFSGAYDRSEETIQKNLEQYPSIRVVLDIHRDAMMGDDLTKIKPTATVNGRKAAQVMIVVGATDTPELPNAYCSDNLRLALQLQDHMAQTYEGLMRPIYLVDARYNQGLLAGSLLIEFGTDANTLSEALYAGELVGKGLAAILST